MSTNDIINHVDRSVAEAWEHVSQLPLDTIQIGGKTSPKIRHLLNNLCGLPDTTFLEVGSWRGASFISGMAGNEDTVTTGMAIDSWCQYGNPIDTYSEAERMFDENTARWLTGFAGRWHKIKQDLFTITELPATPNVFYYDGPHGDTERGTRQFFPLITKPCIVALDGWGLADTEGVKFTQIGWAEAIKDSGLRIIREWELPSRRYKDIDLWWEGFYVCVVEGC